MIELCKCSMLGNMNAYHSAIPSCSHFPILHPSLTDDWRVVGLHVGHVDSCVTEFQFGNCLRGQKRSTTNDQ